MSKLLLCPSCRSVVPAEQSVRPASFPFCSNRCKGLDLGRWFAEDYKLARPLDADDEEAIQAVLEAQAPEA